MENPSQILLPVLVRHHTVSDNFWLFCIKGVGGFFDRNFVARNNNFNQPATCVHIYSLRYCYSRHFLDERQKILSKTFACLACFKTKKGNLPHKSASRHSNLVIIFFFRFFVPFLVCQILETFRGSFIRTAQQQIFIFNFFFSIRNLLLT